MFGNATFDNYSEEGNVKGLGFINAKTINLNKITSNKSSTYGLESNNYIKKSKILNGLNNTSRFYFVHSYYVDMENKSDILTKTDYDINFTSSFQNKNIFGVQFHPEKVIKWNLPSLKLFFNMNKLIQVIIPTLLLKGESLVKTVNFKNFHTSVILAIGRIFNELETDELIFLIYLFY